MNIFTILPLNLKKVLLASLIVFSGMIISCSLKKENTNTFVVFVTGKVEKISASKAIPLNAKDILTKGDKIKTGENSYAIIQIGDSVTARIQPDSLVEISALFDKNGTELFLGNGQVVSVVKKMSKNSGYNISTPTAVASVRGTSYSVSYYKGRSVLAVKDGKVVLAPKPELKSSQKEMIADTGTSVIISDGLVRRPINEFESLEIEKLSGVASLASGDIKDDSYAALAKKAEDDEARIMKEIIAKGGPIPPTTEEMMKKFGRLNDVTLYSGKRYLGVILEHGAVNKMMTVDGIIEVPGRQIRYNKIVR